MTLLARFVNDFDINDLIYFIFDFHKPSKFQHFVSGYPYKQKMNYLVSSLRDHDAIM